MCAHNTTKYPEWTCSSYYISLIVFIKTKICTVIGTLITGDTKRHLCCSQNETFKGGPKT